MYCTLLYTDLFLVHVPKILRTTWTGTKNRGVIWRPFSKDSSIKTFWFFIVILEILVSYFLLQLMKFCFNHVDCYYGCLGERAWLPQPPIGSASFHLQICVVSIDIWLIYLNWICCFVHVESNCGCLDERAWLSTSIWSIGFIC